MINPWLETHEKDERDALKPVVMSGETGSMSLNVWNVLNRRTRRPRGHSERDEYDLHGVDVDTLNFISFFGMPRQTAEYIQAYSRVGRHVTGTVFDLFNPVHVRDRSHYTRFDRYHDFRTSLSKRPAGTVGRVRGEL